jgi:hypothetical protein
LSGYRVIGTVPLGAWETITFGAAQHHNRMTDSMVVEDAITGEMVLAGIESCSAPMLQRNNIVVMDNCLVPREDRHSRSDSESARDAALSAEKLADLKPMESPYSKFKTFLRREAARTVTASIEQFVHLSHHSVRAKVPPFSGM